MSRVKNEVKNPKAKPFSCDQCSKSYTQKSHLNQHKQLHTGQFSYYCGQCRQGFNVKGHYREHMNKHQGLRFVCDFCSQLFTSEMVRNNHVKTKHHWK